MPIGNHTMHMQIQKLDLNKAGRALAAFVIFAGVAVLAVWRLAQSAPAFGNSDPIQTSAAQALQRDDLDNDEKSTIALFKRASPAVVNITNLASYPNRFRMAATEVPQGSGSGFLWDDPCGTSVAAMRKRFG